MNDDNTQNDNQETSYVDDYVPPTPVSDDSGDQGVNSAPPAAPEPSAPILESKPADEPQTDLSQKSSISQSLEDQNIFHLLGVEDGTDEEKEAFLDELQQVIWEDFLENDVELLLTEDETADLKKISSKKEVDDLQIQEDIVVFLEKLIPDLEEIMLEKALELKEDMVKERIAGMKEFYVGQQEQLDQINKAGELVSESLWRDAAEVLNEIKPQSS
jgi:hypothetical protein